MKKISIYNFVFLFLNTLQAQSSYEIGFLPKVNITTKLENNWSIIFNTETRFNALESKFSSSAETNFNYDLTDVSVLASKKVGSNNKFAFGYFIRFKETETHHRFIQQFAISKQYQGFKLEHRFSTDETIEKETIWQFRLRYRLSVVFPFKNESNNDNPFYFKINNEYLGIFKEKEDADFELRLSPFLGYTINNNNKIEGGLDYRVNSFIENNNDSKHSFWFTIHWLLVL